MKANNPGLKLLPVLAMLLGGSVLADDAVDVAPAPAASAAAATVGEVPQASADKPGLPAAPAWPGSAVPMLMPVMQPMPYVPGLAGRVMFMPVWMQPMPGMPPVLNWFPVILAPRPALTAMPLPPADSVDYGPVSDTPVIELPLPEEVNSQPIEKPGATNAPESVPAAEDASVAAVVPNVAVPTAGTASMVSAPDAPPWSEPTVDYGPVIDTPVVDMLALEKKLFAPAVPAKKQTRSSGTAAAKPVPAPRKARMCWKNGVVAPCK
jgi:hypothetical protein